MTLQRSAPQAEPVQQLHTGNLADMFSARVPSQSVTASTTETLRLICQIGAGLFHRTLFNKHTCEQINDSKDKIR